MVPKLSTATTLVLPTTIADTAPSSPTLKRRSSIGTATCHLEQCNGRNGRATSYHSFGCVSTYSSKQRGWSTWFVGLLVCIMGGALLYNKVQYGKTQELLEQVQKERDVLNRNQGQLLLQLEQSHRKLSQAPKPDEEWLAKIAELHRESRRLESLLTTEKREKKDNLAAIQRLQANMRKVAKRSTIELFGEGPHYVQFELNMPNDDGRRTREFFTVELAPLDLMPLSVYTFLQQTSNSLWDKTSFYLNADHVTIARPVSVDGQFSKRPEFDKHSLAHVPFPEYHEKFPHVKYTLGFSGNPAGPDIYINVDDNTIPHGPAGHQHSGAPEPCFAKVVQGKEVVDRMAKLPGRPDKPAMMADPVEIVSAQIIDSLREDA